jgi:NADH dehydrogenase
VRIAITGGTGFVGGRLAGRLTAEGHDVIVVSRRTGTDVTDRISLAAAFTGADAIVHCAGINRELGKQTYRAVHVQGTAAVVDAARSAGARRLVMLSFLRARPDGPSAYHRSKWAAEVLVRGSGLEHTIVKAGVIHGRGDHMLDHLSRAFHTFPVFGLVGLGDRLVRPMAVADVVRILSSAAAGDARLVNRTIAAVGPEELPLGEAVRRVADAVGRRPRFVRLPISIHRVLAMVFEATMVVPLVSTAQVEILAEGVVVPLPFADPLPDDLLPRTPFSVEAIRDGLPEPAGFGRRDCRCLA